MKVIDGPVIVTQDFNSSISKVWSAITDPSEMTQWYFENIPDFAPKIGFETKFVVKVEDRSYTHCWKVTEVIPNKKICTPGVMKSIPEMPLYLLN